MRCLECKGTELVQRQDFIVCEKCKAVFAAKDSSTGFDELLCRTQKLIDDFQEFLSQHENALHKIVQKEHFGEMLSKQELKIREFLSLFHQARTNFIGLPRGTNLECRRAMYSLLVEIQENLPEIKELMDDVNIQM